jgi:tetratricopeptide (TPR) repeat protein
MFGFGKKDTIADEIKQILSTLEAQPNDTKSRLKLASLYLRSGDQETAVEHYREAADQLSAEGSYLEPIAIYQKILSLDGFSLTQTALAAVREAEGLLAKARKTYEKIFQVDSLGNEARETSESPYELDQEGKNAPEREEAASDDHGRSTPIELVPDPCYELDLSGMDPAQTAADHIPDEGVPAVEPSLSRAVEEPDLEGKEQAPFLSSDVPLLAIEEDSDKGELKDAPPQTETAPATDPSPPDPSPKIDVNKVQIDDDLETMLSDDEDVPPADTALSPDTPIGLDEENPLDTPSSPQASDLPDTPSKPDTAETIQTESDQEDPDLHYNLGIAYYKMDLIDKAITQFIEARDEGVRTVESLFMLAKCHYERDLFDEAAGFIDQALKLDNLSQDQVDMLKRQLEEIAANRSSGSS